MGKSINVEIFCYLVFQKSDNGTYRGVYGRYHKVCSINATGREKPKFFDPIKG